jgi:SAM-dependent methyltransferase
MLPDGTITSIPCKIACEGQQIYMQPRVDQSSILQYARKWRSLDAFITALRHDHEWRGFAASLRYLEHARHRFDALLTSLPKVARPLTVLDIGTTPFTLFLKQQYPHYQIATIDLTPFWQEHCRRQGIDFHPCDLACDDLPFADESFDVVIFTEVLEHLTAAPVQVLKKIQRVLRLGGQLLFSVPNFASLRNRITLLCGRSPLELHRSQFKSIHGHGHLREYTLHELERIFATSDLKPIHCRFIQSSILDVFKRHEPLHVKLMKSLYYALSLFPSLKLTIFLKAVRVDDTDPT